jgi:beta-galactosidase/beta-glucuronidase
MKLKLTLFFFFFLVSTGCLFAQTHDWKIVGNKIKTEWADKVDPENTLPEYPRPQMVRNTWVNLNGLWSYSIQSADKTAKPASFSGKILVPFAIESALSGVGKTVSKDQAIWYNRTITLPATFNNKNVLLHFGAVDWLCDVYVNGKKAGTHKGGYDPFTFDVTALLNKSKQQEITIRVWDPTDQGYQPRGKQVKDPNGIWYTPVSGIWQTVWAEAVPKTYITSTKQTPDIDQQTLTVSTSIKNAQPNDLVKITVFDHGKKVTEVQRPAADQLLLNIDKPKLWSPNHPFLYDLSIAIVRNGKVVDEVKSYFAMRKISMKPDAKGVQRILLNNEFTFQYGPLDQGWWPDGLYTAPTDEALKFDIVKTKEMGFNMIRKHVKVEPARWYTYCDQLGILVWQDMPSGDLGNGWGQRPGIIDNATEKMRSAESEASYRQEWNAIIDALYNHPSIVMWVPFNEAWGQFKTIEITEWTMKKDPSRLVNSASGGNYFNTGHVVDYHNYPGPAMPRPDLFGKDYGIVLGEYGGLGLPVPGNTWQNKDNWGYQTFKNSAELFNKYNSYTDRLKEFIGLGLSAAVYTQTTDVEGEINGFMTYDRKIFKMPVKQLYDANQKLYDSSLVHMK